MEHGQPLLLRIVRKRPLSEIRFVTLGSMYVDGDFECFTEEPPMREDNVFVAGESALPCGLYTGSLPKSVLYSRNVPLMVSAQLMGAGGQRLALGMRILPGHYTLENHSVGIVVGKTQNTKNVHHTRAAYSDLMTKLQAAKGFRAIELEIVMEDE